MATATRSVKAAGRYAATRTPRFAQSLDRLLADGFVWLAVARERRRLLRLDDRTLKDIGLSRADAVREAGRSFWDIPASRRPRHE